MTPPAQTFSITIKGEQHTYTVPAWGELDADTLCRVLSDLSGYRATWLRDGGLTFNRLGYAQVAPSGSWGGPPVFLVRSSDGRPMPEREAVKA